MTIPDQPLTARCGGWCSHVETGYDPFGVAVAMLAHWRDAHADQIEGPFLGTCGRPLCGRLCWGKYCCERCLASDDGGPPLGPWDPLAPPTSVHDRACEERARRRAAKWYAGSAAR